FLYASGPGFVSAAIMAVNNLRDRVPDSKRGKITLAVILGERGGALLCCFFVVSSLLVPIIAYYGDPHLQGNTALLLPLLAPLFFAKTWNILLCHGFRGGSSAQQLNLVLASLGVYLLIYVLLLSVVFIQRS
ncbi:MAG: hypothetical protein HQK53_15055, partial [Oligoflexia bacterium]|nr:hypothetical protein [Oligoflexia bacterium]